jgi:D-serine deaminase-like pyridoxal phosphate-dependent protein
MMPLTPRLILDEARLDANIERMAARVRALGGVLRPHVKTHKSGEIARRQLAAGAIGVTVATLREASVMLAAGVDDILIAYPPVGEARLAALAQLAQLCRLTVACSEHAHVLALAEAGLTLDYYWEVDCGAGRLGSPPGARSADAIERALALAGPRYRGLMAFAGQAYGAVGPDARRAVAEEEQRALSGTADELERRGIHVGTLSVGATPLAAFEHPWATEYRFGNYAFCDATQIALGSASLEDCALAVEATVIGVPAEDRVILDAGSKALAAERMSGATAGFGIVRDYPELQVAQLYEEHAICRAPAGGALPALGDRVEVVPNHACTCANLHAAYEVRGRDGWDRWRVEARGWEYGRSPAGSSLHPG